MFSGSVRKSKIGDGNTVDGLAYLEWSLVCSATSRIHMRWISVVVENFAARGTSPLQPSCYFTVCGAEGWGGEEVARRSPSLVWSVALRGSVFDSRTDPGPSASGIGRHDPPSGSLAT